MLKKTVTAILLTLIITVSLVNVSAAPVPEYGITTIYPNSLTIRWEDESRAPITINTFRFFGFNVAQLRTIVNVLDGAVDNLADGTFRVRQDGAADTFEVITFHHQMEIEYIINETPIINHAHELVYPDQPGWVFLPEFGYNWASVRDVIIAMDLALMDVIDDPLNDRTEVIVRSLEPPREEIPVPFYDDEMIIPFYNEEIIEQPTPTPRPTGPPAPAPSRLNDWPRPTPTPSLHRYERPEQTPSRNPRHPFDMFGF